MPTPPVDVAPTAERAVLFHTALPPSVSYAYGITGLLLL